MRSSFARGLFSLSLRLHEKKTTLDTNAALPLAGEGR